MGYELTSNLLMLGLFVWAVCAYIASKELSWPLAVLISAIRVAIPVCYFAWYFDGTWTLIDDYTYYLKAQYFLESGGGPFGYLNQEGVNTLKSVCGSKHIFYYWWNMLVLWVWGSHYYVPVVINVAISFVTAHLLIRLLRECNFEERYSKAVYILYLLYWDTIAWSSIVNMKDQFAQMLTIGLFLFGIRCVRLRSVRYGAACLGIALWLQWVRYYTPFLAAGATGIWLFFEWKDNRKYIALAAACGMTFAYAPPMHQIAELVRPSGLFFGAIRYTLTPQPWTIHDTYSYLLIPSLMHWLLFIPAIYGAFMVWRESRIARLILIYTIVLIMFYAMIIDLQSSRQRYQISFVFAWAQLHFLWRWNHASAMSKALQPSVQHPAVLVHQQT